VTFLSVTVTFSVRTCGVDDEGDDVEAAVEENADAVPPAELPAGAAPPQPASTTATDAAASAAAAPRRPTGGLGAARGHRGRCDVMCRV
jgi:hypothetical protein